MPTPLTTDNLNDPVTMHMRSDFARLQVQRTIGEALSELRTLQPAGRIIYFYVIDDEGRLQGVVPTRRLLLNPPETPLADIMVREVIAVPSSALVLDACEFFIMHRLLAFPIVDSEKRLIGVVDVELYTDEVTSIESNESNEALFQVIGVHVAEARTATAWKLFLSRFPWLMCNVAGGLLAAVLSNVYHAELAWENAVLALFIPVVLALAESVSIQSVTLAMLALEGRRPTWGVLGPRLRREGLTGLLLGCSCALVVGLTALAWKGRFDVTVCLLGGIAGGVFGAAVIGFLMPIVLKLLRRDPQVASGPIALALADMLTLLIYFNLARSFV